MMHENVKKITTIDDYVISLHIFTPSNHAYHESKCDGVILSLHGLGEHTERYRHVAEITCKKNKAFVIFNIRGHGRDAVNKGDVQNLPTLILDIIFAFNTLKQLFTNVKNESFALLGHSFGGLLTTYACAILKNEVRKVFLSSPGYVRKIEIPSWKILMAKNISYLYPKLQIPIDFNPNNISNNPVTNNLYSKDKEVLYSITTRFGKIILDAMNLDNIKTAIKNITAEVTIILPSDDKLIETKGTKQLLSSFQTVVHVYDIEASGHESFNEIKDVQQIAISHYEKWLDNL